MKTNTIIAIVAGLVVIGGGSFFGGVKYAESKAGTTPPSADAQPFGGGPGGPDGRGGRGRNGGFGGGAGGEILSLDDKSATIKLRDGGSKIIFLSGSTQVMKTVQGTLKDLAVGQTVLATGASNPDGSVNAQTVQIRPPMPDQKAAAPLTEIQKAEFAAGAAPHAPTSLTFDVNGGMFWFAPNEIRVKKGDKVRINFTSNEGHHNFIIDQFDVKVADTDTGNTSSAEFTADKTGTFEFYCGVGKHRQMGQKGTLIVE